MRLLRARALTAVLLLLTLTACSGGSDAESSTNRSSNTDEPAYTSEARLVDCGSLLNTPEIRRLAGGTLSGFDAGTVGDVEDAPNGCSAHVDGPHARGKEVSLMVVPAQEAIDLVAPWLEEIDGLSILSPDHQAAVSDALGAARSSETDDARACEIFSAFAFATQKQQRGSTYVVMVRDGGRVLFAQGCTDGIYVAVSLSGSRAGTEPSSAHLARLRAAVAAYSPGRLTPYRKPVVDDSACQLLSPETVETLAGAEAEAEPGSLPGSGIPACAFGTEVVVSQGPATDWLRAVPGLLELLVDQGMFADRPAVLRRIEVALKIFDEHGSIERGEACALALEIGIAADTMVGADTWAGQMPLAGGPPFLQFVRCRDETTSVVVLRRSVSELDRDTVLAILAALDEIS